MISSHKNCYTKLVKDIDLKQLIYDILKNTDCNLNYNNDYEKVIEMVFNLYDTVNPYIKESDLQNYKNYVLSKISELLSLKKTSFKIDYTQEDINKISFQVESLKLLPQPEQRTDDWYKFRNNRLTASDLGTVVGTNPYSSLNKLILKKCGHEEPFKINAAITHGVKYEDVAIAIYELRNNVNVFEFGCLPHPKVDFFGASPDGICDKSSKNKNYIGRMLEIKCPTKRPITGFPPEYYYAQVQGQLEVCDLEYCDFLECKIVECSKEEWCNDGDNLYQDNGMEKGILVEIYDNLLLKSKYEYIPLGTSIDKFEKFQDDIINKVCNDSNLDYVDTLFWKLEVYECTLINRDKKWFSDALIKIKSFWDSVLNHRKIGYESLLPKKKNKKIYDTSLDYEKNNKKYQFLD